MDQNLTYCYWPVSESAFPSYKGNGHDSKPCSTAGEAKNAFRTIRKSIKKVLIMDQVMFADFTLTITNTYTFKIFWKIFNSSIVVMSAQLRHLSCQSSADLERMKREKSFPELDSFIVIHWYLGENNILYMPGEVYAIKFECRFVCFLPACSLQAATPLDHGGSNLAW